MANIVQFEAEAPDGSIVRFRAPSNSTPEELQRMALTEYQLRMANKAQYLREPAPRVEPPAESPAGLMQQAAEMGGKVIDEMGGASTGAAVGLGAALAEKLGMGPGAIGQKTMEAIRQPPSGPPPLGATPVAPSGPTPAQQVARIHQGAAGDMGTTGRQRMAGFNEPTAQVAARKELLEPRLRSLGLDPTRIFAEAADVTATPSGVLYPKGVTPPDLTPPARLSPLEQAKQMLLNVMDRSSQVSKGVARVAQAMPVLSYPLAGVSVGRDVEEMREQMRKPTPDYTDIGLLGAGALGTVGSLFPATAPVALPVAFGAPAMRYLRRKREPVGPVPIERQLPGLQEKPPQEGYLFP